MLLVIGSITVSRVSVCLTTAIISAWYSSHSSLPNTQIILINHHPSSTSIPAPIAALMSPVLFVNEPSPPPAASHITSKTALAPTHAASIVRASSKLSGSAIGTASSRTTSWNGTGRPGRLKTLGTATRTNVTFAAADSLG